MAQDMTLLWGSGSPPCWRVMITLEEKNLQGYNQKRFDFQKMEHKSAEVMAMNPRGQLPAFRHGDKILNESYAAIIYLEDQFKSQGNKLIPDSPAERAMMYQRMMEGNTLIQKINEVLYYHWRTPEGEKHDSSVRRLREALTAELKLWEGYLGKVGDGYLAGRGFSLADVAVFPTFPYIFHYTKQHEKRYPNLAAYCNRLKDRPSIKATWPSTWLENPQGMEAVKDA